MNTLTKLFLYSVFLFTHATHAAEQIVTLNIAQDITLSYLLRTADNNNSPTHIAILLPGSPGIMRLRMEEGVPKFDLSGNFLIRARRHFVDDRFAIAALDAPSDQWGRDYSGFRSSPRHIDDVRKVIADLKQRFPNVKVLLIGTSDGTLSSALVGKALAPELEAVIHTATITRPMNGYGLSIWKFDYGEVGTRQLFVHHEKDPCRYCAYDAAKDIAEKFRQALITVRGGTSEGDPCMAYSYHGFRMKEVETIQAIKAWVRAEPYAAVIE